MPFPSETFVGMFPSTLQPVADELRAQGAQLIGYLSREHHEDGSHANVTADSVTTDTATITDLTVTTETVDTLTIGTQIRIPDGTVTVPGLGFESDQQTGLYRESLPFSRSAVHVSADGVDALSVRASAGNGGQCELPNSPGATGASAKGPFFLAGRNASGSGAPGCLGLTDRSGTLRFLFLDTNGILRWHTSQPSESGGDLVGTGFGNYTSVTFASGNFTTNAGTWTVASGDQITFKWRIIGRSLLVVVTLQGTTVATNPADLKVAIPGGFTAVADMRGTFHYSDNGTKGTGYWYVTAAGTTINFRKVDDSTWVNATDATNVEGQAEFEV